LFFDFDKDDVRQVWDTILQDINRFKEKQLAFSNNLVQQLQTTAIGKQTPQEIIAGWNAENPNPISKLADNLNKILHSFYLEVPATFNSDKAEDLAFIQVRRTSERKDIPRNGWSTGTKQLILSATPIFQLPTSKTVMLMDEPERSFYPDIQRKLPAFYTSLAPEAQFFFATHSPIIASCFEPWEIVELKFNEEGYVYQERYFTGERHVDNYTLYPQYLRWDQILTEVFDLPSDGNDGRKEKIQRLTWLRNRLAYLGKNGNDAAQEQATLWEGYRHLAGLLNWEVKDWTPTSTKA